VIAKQQLLLPTVFGFSQHVSFKIKQMFEFLILCFEVVATIHPLVLSSLVSYWFFGFIQKRADSVRSCIGSDAFLVHARPAFVI